MKYEIERISLHGVRWLKDRPSGAVHSAYERAVNISVEGRIFCLQPKGSPFSPVSLITGLSEEEFAKIRVKKGDPVLASEQEIALFSGGRTVVFARGREEVMDLELGAAPGLAELFALDFGLDAGQGLGSGFGLADDLLGRKIGGILARGLALAMERNWERAAAEYGRLLGLGIGLTPSGDDFLCGLLAALRAFGKEWAPLRQALGRRILNNLSRTNEISGEFLMCAIDGQYGEAVHLFFHGNPKEGVEQMKKIGHSSGLDTLCGIVHGLELREKFKEE